VATSKKHPLVKPMSWKDWLQITENNFKSIYSHYGNFECNAGHIYTIHIQLRIICQEQNKVNIIFLFANE
jgi:hypothetical protein